MLSSRTDIFESFEYFNSCCNDELGGVVVVFCDSFSTIEVFLCLNTYRLELTLEMDFVFNRIMRTLFTYNIFHNSPLVFFYR